MRATRPGKRPIGSARGRSTTEICEAIGKRHTASLRISMRNSILRWMSAPARTMPSARGTLPLQTTADAAVGGCLLDQSALRPRGGEVDTQSLRERLAGATVVCLVKSTTETQWWQTYTPHAEIRYIKGRITFHGAKHRAPFSVCLVIFRPA